MPQPQISLKMLEEMTEEELRDCIKWANYEIIEYKMFIKDLEYELGKRK